MATSALHELGLLTVFGLSRVCCSCTAFTRKYPHLLFFYIVFFCLLENVFPQSPVDGSESNSSPEGNEVLDIQPKPSSPDRTNPSSPKSHITPDIGKKRKKVSEAGRGQSSSHGEPQGKRSKGVVVKPTKTSYDDGNLQVTNWAGPQANEHRTTASRLETDAKGRQEQSGLTMEQKGVEDHIARNQKRIPSAVQVNTTCVV